jgi:hypothetical protein
MASIPLDIQRRFEQRWAAKFFFRLDPTAPKTQELKTQVQQQAAAGEGKEHAGLGARVDEVPRSAKGGWTWLMIRSIASSNTFVSNYT